MSLQRCLNVDHLSSFWWSTFLMCFWIIYLFIFVVLFYLLRLHWVFIAMCGLSVVTASEGYSSRGVQASQCGAISHCPVQALGCKGFSSSGAQVSLPLSTWDLLGSGITPMSFALAGGFLTTGPPGKPSQVLFKIMMMMVKRGEREETVWIWIQY